MIDQLIKHLPIVSCQVATRLMSESLERKLSLKEYIQLKLHLMVCLACVRFLKQVRGLREVSRSYQPRGEKNLSLPAKARIKQVLMAAGS